MLAIDDHQFKREASLCKQELERSYSEYEQSLRNLTEAHPQAEVGEDSAMRQLSGQILPKYNEVIAKADEHSNYLSYLLSQDIEGVKASLKEELLLKLKEIGQYKDRYERILAPMIVEKVESRLNSTFLLKLKEHAATLKRHLDSEVFRRMDLHPEVPNPQLISKWPIFVFLWTAVLCLLFSTFFHWFHPLSRSNPAVT
jgi:hypothetical protein